MQSGRICPPDLLSGTLNATYSKAATHIAQINKNNK